MPQVSKLPVGITVNVSTLPVPPVTSLRLRTYEYVWGQRLAAAVRARPLAHVLRSPVGVNGVCSFWQLSVTRTSGLRVSKAGVARVGGARPVIPVWPAVLYWYWY